MTKRHMGGFAYNSVVINRTTHIWAKGIFYYIKLPTVNLFFRLTVG